MRFASGWIPALWKKGDAIRLLGVGWVRSGPVVDTDQRWGLAALKQWLKGSRSLPLLEIVGTLKRKLQGCWKDYGVIGNSERLWDYAWNAKRLVLNGLNRRSRRRSYNWTSFEQAWERWKIPRPQVIEKSRAPA